MGRKHEDVKDTNSSGYLSTSPKQLKKLLWTVNDSQLVQILKILIQNLIFAKLFLSDVFDIKGITTYNCVLALLVACA